MQRPGPSELNMGPAGVSHHPVNFYIEGLYICTVSMAKAGQFKHGLRIYKGYLGTCLRHMSFKTILIVMIYYTREKFSHIGHTLFCLSKPF